jgi:nicotinate-nucleotide pyrophosphorylase (carboxylating)
MTTVPALQRANGRFVARVPGVVAGVPVAALVLDVVSDGAVNTELLVDDGTPISAGTAVMSAEGPTRALLTAERTALNLICRLSGIATLTAEWVSAVAGTGAAIRDTRKTTPGLRVLEKYAVRCGGGQNHRMGLGDAALIKDNHVAAAGSISAAYAAVRSAGIPLEIEVECDTLDQVREALDVGADLILLENFDVTNLRAAVDLRGAYPDVRLEASGGLTLANARAVAETGVEFLAVGALTHSAPILDIGLDLVEAD